MGIKSKTAKGEITVENYRGRIRLRWRHEGERYSLNLPYPYLPENQHYAVVRSAEIKLDILKGCFDTSLKKYQPPAPAKPVIASLVKEEATLPSSNEVVIPALSDLVAKFNDWGNNIKNIDVENSIDYFFVRRLLEKWVDMPLEKTAELLNGEAWAVTTYNRRLHYLKDFFGWLLGQGIISQNPLAAVCRKRDKGKKKNPRRVPLSEIEIMRFLTAIRENTYCPTASRFKHSHYHPFLLFIFLTGVRNSEAIGLKVKHVELEKGHIEISEVLARTIKGSNHAVRVTKGTKTENTRYLPLTDELRELLLPQMVNKGLDDLVFLSPRGLSINDQMLEKRILKPVMKALGIGDRDLYVARHSFGTRAIQQGMVITDVAYLMGHANIETAMRNYVGVGKASVVLPVINKGEQAK